MRLEQIYEMQKTLDALIIEEKGLQGQELLPNTVLALQVELGELANEWRGFKHWSDRQEPQYGYAAKINCDRCSGKGFWFDGERVVCGKCSGVGKITNPLLEEYVDCLHFFLSIARQLGIPNGLLLMPEQFKYDKLHHSTAVVFTTLLYEVSVLNAEMFLNHPPMMSKHRRLCFALCEFLQLGEERFGFTFDQIAAAYLEKNQTNHKRQTTGY